MTDGFTQSIQSQNFWILRSRASGEGPSLMARRAASAQAGDMKPSASVVRSSSVVIAQPPASCGLIMVMSCSMSSGTPTPTMASFFMSWSIRSAVTRSSVQPMGS